MPTRGPSYTSISDYLNANQGTLANEAAKVGGDVQGQLNAAQTADNQALSGAPSVAGDFTTAPGYADADQKQIAATQAARNLGSPSGLATQLQSSYAGKSPDFNQDQANWDGQLLSAANPPSFAGIEKQGQTLSGYLQNGPTAAAPTQPKFGNLGAPPPGSLDDPGTGDQSSGLPAGTAQKLSDDPSQWQAGRRTSRIGGPY